MKIQEARCKATVFHTFLNIESIVRAGILLSAFIVVGYCLWTLDRGFEITDEAYYLLLAIYAESIGFYISAQHWVTAGIWNLTESIMMFRAAGMFVLLSSAVLLAIGVFSTCVRFGIVKNSFELKCVVLAGSVIGAMLYASTINFSPSYNLLASAGAYAAAGLVLLATNHSNKAYKYVLFILAGCALGVEILSKPSAGISTLLLLILWVGIFECSRANSFFGLVAIIIGMSACVVFFLLANTTISHAAHAVEQGMQLFRMVQVEPIGARLVRYFTEYWRYFLLALTAFVIPIVALIVYAATRKVIFLAFGLIVLVITLLFGTLDAGLLTFSINNAISNSFLFGGTGRYLIQIAAIVAMLLMGLIVTTSLWSKSLNMFALIIGLILLPYSVAMGTGNTMFTQVIVSLAPWGVLIAVLVVADHSDYFSKITITLIGTIFMATVALQIVTSGFRPYKLSLPLTKQNQEITVANLGNIRVDEGTYKFLADMKTAIKTCDIAPEVHFIGLYNIPGVALALQAAPLIPWINNKAQAEFVIARARPAELRSVVVAVQMLNGGGFPPLPQQLASFPSGYRYCGKGTYPYGKQKIQIWQLLAR